MKRFIGLFAFLFVVALISGCDSAKDEDPTVTGVWSGTASVLGVSITITMNLLEDNQIVTGTGTIGSIAATLTGTHRYPDVSRTSTSTGFRDSNYTGTLSADGQRISGTWTEPGINGVPLTLRK